MNHVNTAPRSPGEQRPRWRGAVFPHPATEDLPVDKRALAVHNLALTNRERKITMSTALTLHNIDDELYAAVRDYARETKTSLGAAFKQLARRALGLPTAEEKARIDAANALFGCLSEEDVRPIREALKLQSQIEPEMWK
jgi:hypothetical protein